MSDIIPNKVNELLRSEDIRNIAPTNTRTGYPPSMPRKGLKPVAQWSKYEKSTDSVYDDLNNGHDDE